MSARIIRVIAFLLMLPLGCKDLCAQDARVKSADGEFIMELYREANCVRAVIYFTDASKYSYLIIEKEESASQFRQCGYVDLRDQGSYGGAIEVKDKYPPSILNNMYYRIRTVTTDRIERIYPPVLLPAAATPSPEKQ